MKRSWIKTSNDNKSFKVFENLGFNVISLDEPEDTDKKIEELINNDCKTIILSNEIASFSKDIITKYINKDDISIIVASRKKFWKGLNLEDISGKVISVYNFQIWK